LRATSKDKKRKAEEQKRINAINAEFTALSRRALIARGCADIASEYSNPDYDPDLPFLWRATEWAKADGIIAMALPGRLILKQGGRGKTARDAVLRGLAVTGILNGSDLEKTPVWPNMDLPFLLLFARNSLPKPDHHFHFVTPVRENRLSRRGLFRLDYKAAETVAARVVIEKPWMLKALAVGTVLDVDVVDKLPQGVVREFWKKHDLYSGKGYDLFPGTVSTSDLRKLKDFEAPGRGFALRTEALLPWSDRHEQIAISFPRNKRLYEPPLVIVSETPRESRLSPKAFVSWREAIAFSRSNYGYSAASSANAKLFISGFYLAVHSRLFQHFCLMRSSRQGASFRTILKEDLDEFPFPDPSELNAADQARLIALAEALETQEAKPWDEIDDFIFNLYGLDEHDARVVLDTVEFCGPYETVRDRAEEPVPPEELETFREYLESMLQPLFEISGQRLAVRLLQQKARERFPSWQFVGVTLAGDELQNTQELLTRLMSDATKTGASRIILRVPDGGLLLGIINARRFWTRSRARLCGLHIEQSHMDAFPMETR
jgi:hypothetical protein